MARCYRIKPEQWQENVEGALAVLNDNKLDSYLATLIIGLPDEKKEDVLQTLN